MNEWTEGPGAQIDMAEIYRENYQDALDEIRYLKLYIQELEQTNRDLNRELDSANLHIRYYESSYN